MFVTWYKDGKQVYTSYRYSTKVTQNSCVLESLHESTQKHPEHILVKYRMLTDLISVMLT